MFQVVLNLQSQTDMFHFFRSGILIPSRVFCPTLPAWQKESPGVLK